MDADVSGEVPYEGNEIADLNGDGSIDIIDVVVQINIVLGAS